VSLAHLCNQQEEHHWQPCQQLVWPGDRCQEKENVVCVLGVLGVHENKSVWKAISRAFGFSFETKHNGISSVARGGE